ncbi:MAG: DUF456 domain-containing protein [Candidatus Azobacteroides sp.]|nr:DUF456 domain-containing protein [Candidatus Azobacteroides sp.]
MDIVLIILGIIFILGGIVGCVIPAIPGPPLSWLGLLMMKFTSQLGGKISWNWIIIWAVIVVLVSILDYLLPIWSTKKMGGTKPGIWGATIGMVIGMLFLPWGLILGPFLGALVGESLTRPDKKDSFKAAFGTFIGFASSAGIKLLTCGLLASFVAIKAF